MTTRTKRGQTMAKPKSKKAQVARLEERLEALTGKGTEQMRASLQAQIDELMPGKGGIVDSAKAHMAGEGSS